MAALLRAPTMLFLAIGWHYICSRAVAVADVWMSGGGDSNSFESPSSNSMTSTMWPWRIPAPLEICQDPQSRSMVAMGDDDHNYTYGYYLAYEYRNEGEPDVCVQKLKQVQDEQYVAYYVYAEETQAKRDVSPWPLTNALTFLQYFGAPALESFPLDVGTLLAIWPWSGTTGEQVCAGYYTKYYGTHSDE
eukprot:350462-Amphidinium_carterae.1